ncbi:Pentatricopeptide repeat-containing protein [Nymphaea thermarum]|nr:Pentatricopeptide repeat-containing protein [Nymphaea thermarum]
MVAAHRTQNARVIKASISRHYELQRRHFDYTHQVSSTKFRTQQFGNDEISRLCKQGKYHEAFGAFESITKTNFKVNPGTYARLIQASSNLKSLEHGKRVHDHLVKYGDPPDTILWNHILNMYGKCGSLGNARRVFDEMPVKNFVSWTAIIAGYSQHGDGKEAVRLYRRMRQEGLAPDKFLLANIARACSILQHVELGRQIHGHVVKSEDGLEPLVQNALVSMYTKCNLVEDAEIVFDRIGDKNMVSWTSMIAGLSQNNFVLKALWVFKEMLTADKSVNELTFGSVFKACSCFILLEQGKQIHGLSMKHGFSRDVFVGCSLVDMYAKCGDLASARQSFYMIQDPDVASWNAIIGGHACSQYVDGALHVFALMQNYGTEPDPVTILCLLNACRSFPSLIVGQSIHSYIIKSGFDINVAVCNALLTMYGTYNLSDALSVFHVMDKQDPVSWNAIMAACIQHNEVDNVFRLFRLMHRSDMKPDSVTLISCLSAASKVAALELGIQVHDYAIKLGFDLELSVANGLIDMYAKCGALESAKNFFSWMSNPDVASWSSLIVGYAQFGSAEKALSLFDEMVRLGFKPNSVTFVGVLSACSRVGLVDEGYNHYRTMTMNYGITPTRSHCSCMVDLLGRVGRLSEACDFINQMLYEPDVVVWKSLLSACRIHGDLALGEKAAKKVLQLDPTNSSAFVLLSNIYAASSHWDDVAKLRQIMRQRGVKKDPGKSWVKTNGKFHVFVSEDRTHLQMEDIYAVLGDLYIQMDDVHRTESAIRDR